MLLETLTMLSEGQRLSEDALVKAGTRGACLGMRRDWLATVLPQPRLLGSGCVSGKSTRLRLGPVCAFES